MLDHLIDYTDRGRKLVYRPHAEISVINSVRTQRAQATGVTSLISSEHC